MQQETFDIDTAHQDETLIREDEAAITTTNSPASPVVQALQHQLANSLILFLNYKTGAWQSSGKSFQQLQRLFTEVSEETKTAFDALGDRLRMIGQDPELKLEAISMDASVKQSLPASSAVSMAQLASENLIAIIRELRDQIRALRVDEEDPGTTAMLIDLLRMHEKHEWYMRQIAND